MNICIQCILLLEKLKVYSPTSVISSSLFDFLTSLELCFRHIDKFLFFAGYINIAFKIEDKNLHYDWCLHELIVMQVPSLSCLNWSYVALFFELRFLLGGEMIRRSFLVQYLPGNHLHFKDTFYHLLWVVFAWVPVLIFNFLVHHQPP